MIPQTVPNRPMNGVALAGGGEKGKEILHARHLLMGRLVHRAVDVLDGKGRSTSARRRLARAACAPLPLDPGQFKVPRAEYLGEGGLFPLFGLLVERGQAFPLGEGAGESGRFRSIPLKRRTLRKIIAQEITENPIRSSRTSLTMGPASMTCFNNLGVEYPPASAENRQNEVPRERSRNPPLADLLQHPYIRIRGAVNHLDNIFLYT